MSDAFKNTYIILPTDEQPNLYLINEELEKQWAKIIYWDDFSDIPENWKIVLIAKVWADVKKILEYIKEPDIEAKYEKWGNWANWIRLTIPNKLFFDILDDPVNKVVDNIAYLLQFQNFPIPGWMETYNFKKIRLSGDDLEIEFFYEGPDSNTIWKWSIIDKEPVKTKYIARFYLDKNGQLFKNELFIPSWHHRVDYKVGSKIEVSIEPVDKWTTIFWQGLMRKQVTLEAFRKKETTPE